MGLCDAFRRLWRRRRRNRIDERRTISVGDATTLSAPRRSEFCDNTVTSSKYNIFTFLPLNLFDQLQRPINVYFVLLSALQFVPTVAPVNPYTTLFPLAVALLANTVKEGFDDLRRHRQDRENNRRVYRVVDPHTRSTREVQSKDIHVGDVVLLGPSEVVPCDMVVLFSSGTDGAVLISTASIDGETGTKEKYALLNEHLSCPPHGDREPSHTRAATGTSADERLSGVIDVDTMMQFLSQSQLVLECEGPNPFLQVFTGMVHYTLPSHTSSLWRDQRHTSRAQTQAPTPSARGVRLRLQSGSSSTSALAESDEASRLLNADDGHGGYTRLPASVATRLSPPPPHTGSPKMQSVTPDNFVLAYSRVENTRAVVGLATFTGMESKLSMTRNTPKTKVASIDRSLNYLAIPLFAFEFTLVVIYSLLSCIHLQNAPSRMWYLAITPTHRVLSNEFFPILPLRFFTMLTPMVPMSFKTMLEISKAYISAVIRWDDGLKHHGKSIMVNNSALAEELGRVEYVLSDKTGTFTQNQMRFRCLVTATAPATLYEHPSILNDAGLAYSGNNAEGEPDGFAQARRANLPFTCSTSSTHTVPYKIGDPTYFLILSMAFCNTIEPALVNTVTDGAREVDGGAQSAAAGRRGPSANSKWLSVSPDEVALVEGAEALGGMRLLSRSRRSARVQCLFRSAGAYQAPAVYLDATVCHVLCFTSERGRMSVLIQLHRGADAMGVATKGTARGRNTTTEDNVGEIEYLLLMKGSDEHVLPLCADTFHDVQYENILATLAQLASWGLRTLVYGYRHVPNAEAERWLGALRECNASYATAEERQARVKSLHAEIERDLMYCGCTAVEDLLQEELPETILQLRHAGIRTWMLTGDRTETARQTAVASGLLRPRDTVVSLLPENATVRQTAADHFAHVKTQLDRVWCDLVRLGLVSDDGVSAGRRWSRRWRLWYKASGLRDVVHEFTDRRTVDGDGAVLQPLNSQLRHAQPYASHALIRRLTTGAASMDRASIKLDYCVLLSGGVTKMIFACTDAELRRRFRLVLLHAQTVICSRTAPDQKALFVDTVRASGKVTLAIGDGGNDVAMIQSANVGVGICGKEGSQAALAADFAIGEFRLLARLLLVHGHMAYERSAMIIQQSFWKTVLIAWVQMLFNHWTDFSGISYWDSFSLMLYNAIPTVPVTFLCVMDVPLSPLLLLQNPQLYTMSQRGRYLSATTFYGYVLRALLHGSAVFLISLGLQCSAAGGILRNGWELDRLGDFYVAYFAVVTIHTFTVCVESHSVTFAHWQCFLFSVWSCFLSFGLTAAVPGTNQTFSVLLHNPSFYLQYVVLTATVCLSLSLYASVKMLWFPDLLQLQRTANHSVGHRRFRQLWGAQTQRLMQLLWRDENPSDFLWSFSPCRLHRRHDFERQWDEEATARADAEDDTPHHQGDTPV